MIDQVSPKQTNQDASEDLQDSGSEALSDDDVVALTKFVVLEWSQELDYQMYHDLPMLLLLVWCRLQILYNSINTP